MCFSVAKEERCQLEKFRFPKGSRDDGPKPEPVERQSSEASISQHRQVNVEIMEDQVSEDSLLFQKLSEYKMVSIEDHSPRPHQHKKSQQGTSQCRNVKGRESVSPLRQWHGQSSATDSNYIYHSPKETIRNLNEQMERNFNGRYGSLSEFANDNKLDVEGKVFASCEEPKIDLDQGLEEALEATRIS
ncbi:hypothetical protein ZYGM_000443 [Zygosaccharomyces mellis]|uniref:Uncharacterized protein n=1 Tax=Zygosaccharomyces mellis TaxID=42258 RepID=A0A4C2EB58_9SACH|nr:hypothetical protein ZYGM_000443 [Zygosaccharomyces mellis]